MTQRGFSIEKTHHQESEEPVIRIMAGDAAFLASRLILPTCTSRNPGCRRGERAELAGICGRGHGGPRVESSPACLHGGTAHLRVEGRSERVEKGELSLPTFSSGTKGMRCWEG